MTALRVDPLSIIGKYFHGYPLAHRLVVEHSRAVADKAVRTAEKVLHLRPDLKFIEEAAMLHDIGIFMTNAPKLGCLGDKPYICHGYLGRELLEGEGLSRHALVSERHVGVGLTKTDIEALGVAFPERDMTPVSTEERIVCFADKFYSKDDPLREKPVDEVRRQIAGYGADKLRVFDGWLSMFGY